MRTGWFKLQTDATHLDRVKGILMSRLNLKYNRGPRKRAEPTEAEEPEDEEPAVESAEDEESSTDEEPLENEKSPKRESPAKDKSPPKDEEAQKDVGNPWDIEFVKLSELLGSLDKEDSDINDKCIIKAEVYRKGKKDEQYGMRCKSRQPCDSLSILIRMRFFFDVYSRG